MLVSTSEVMLQHLVFFHVRLASVQYYPINMYKPRLFCAMLLPGNDDTTNNIVVSMLHGVLLDLWSHSYRGCYVNPLLPGLPVSFNVTVRSERNYPLDVYLLLDTSASLSDDLDSLRDLSSVLSETAWFPQHT